MALSNSNKIKIAETEIKLIELKKKLIGLRRQLRDVDVKSLEEPLSKTGKAPQSYISSADLREDIQLAEEEMTVLENYKKVLQGISPNQSAQPKLRKNEVVKKEFEKIRQKKEYNPGSHIDEILDEVAEKLGLTFEAAKKSFYYKPKK
jgi:hypothetical protein